MYVFCLCADLCSVGGVTDAAFKEFFIVNFFYGCVYICLPLIFLSSFEFSPNLFRDGTGCVFLLCFWPNLCYVFVGGGASCLSSDCFHV